MSHKGAVLSLLEWGMASRPMPGNPESGDRYLVQTFHGGVLAAVVDGLGHGAQAAEASLTATGTMARYPAESLVSLVVRCDAALSRTRGAVMSLASFDETRGTMSWIAVGNVAGLLVRARNHGSRRVDHLLECRGVVGYQLSTLRDAVLTLSPGDTLIFATDGIAPGFEDDLPIGRSPQDIADRILARWALPTDDALVLAVRWRGREP
jgi:hypothetical protein